VEQIIYTHVSKCKSNKRRRKKKTTKMVFFFPRVVKKGKSSAFVLLPDPRQQSHGHRLTISDLEWQTSLFFFFFFGGNGVLSRWSTAGATCSSFCCNYFRDGGSQKLFAQATAVLDKKEQL
jgi:hypothetical protein